MKLAVNGLSAVGFGTPVFLNSCFAAQCWQLTLTNRCFLICCRVFFCVCNKRNGFLMASEFGRIQVCQTLDLVGGI